MDHLVSVQLLYDGLAYIINVNKMVETINSTWLNGVYLIEHGTF